MMSTLAAVALLASTPFNETFDRAVDAQRAGDAAAAVALYEQLAAEGVSDPAVFFNLGHGYAQLGRLGPAIANYERALQLDPTFEKAGRDLAQSVGKTQRHLGRPGGPSWQQRALFWQSFLPVGAARALAILFWFALWILLGVRVLAPVRYLRRAALVSAVLAVAFAGGAWIRSHPPLMAVVAAPEVAVRAGIREDAAARYRLYEGDRVLVERREPGWARVRSALDERGWVPAESLAWIGPPYERPAEPAPQPSRLETAP